MLKKHDIEYNGTSLSSLGFRIADMPKYTISTRKFEITDVINRDGGVITDAGIYDNKEISYNVVSLPHLVATDTTANLVQLFADWLTDFDGEYKTFKDSYVDGYFTKAICSGIDEITVNAKKCISARVNFIRCPYWYDDDGQNATIFKLDPGKTIGIVNIYNPENQPALPLIKINNQNGHIMKMALTVGNELLTTSYEVKIVNNISANSIILDSEFQSAFVDKNTLANRYISCLTFPQLWPGWNKIGITSLDTNSFSSIEITPRWRRL